MLRSISFLLLLSFGFLLPLQALGNSGMAFDGINKKKKKKLVKKTALVRKRIPPPPHALIETYGAPDQTHMLFNIYGGPLFGLPIGKSDGQIKTLQNSFLLDTTGSDPIRDQEFAQVLNTEFNPDEMSLLPPAKSRNTLVSTLVMVRFNSKWKCQDAKKVHELIVRFYGAVMPIAVANNGTSILCNGFEPIASKH